MKEANSIYALEFSEPITEDVTKLSLAEDKPRIFIAGDSTACNYRHAGANNRYPRTGWGQVFGEQFNDNIQVVNCAISGRSSLSFRREVNYRFICENMRRGDYLFIQFAHNDSKAEDRSRFTSPDDGSYQSSICEYINAARGAGAEPVLCTSVTRNLISDTTLEPYGNALKELARANGTALLDMYEHTHSLLLELGADVYGQRYMNLAPRDSRFSGYADFSRSEYYENGCADHTHLNITGAREAAAAAADELKRICHPLSDYLL